MPVSDLDDLLKDKTVTLHPRSKLYLAILDQAQFLRNEKPGMTIAQIESSNDTWVGKNVAVLPDPRSGDLTKTLRIQPVAGLELRQLKIYYYDANEVEQF